MTEDQNNDIAEEAIPLPAWRKPTYNRHGTIDIEISIGGRWLPFTADPSDIEEMGRLLHAAVIEAGGIAAATSPDPDELKAEILAAAQGGLDDFARTRGYDSLLSATSYTTSANPQFAAEAAYAVQIRDATWTRLFELLAEVQSGARPVPSGYADIEPLLPRPVWPGA